MPTWFMGLRYGQFFLVIILALIFRMNIVSIITLYTVACSSTFNSLIYHINKIKLTSIIVYRTQLTINGRKLYILAQFSVTL